MNFEECYWFCRKKNITVRSITLDGEHTFDNNKGRCLCHTKESAFVNKEYVDIDDRYYLLTFGSTCSFESVPTCK